jgi:hypothetical protein
VNNATVLAQRQALTNVQGIFWGGLVAGILDAVDGAIAFGAQGFPFRSCRAVDVVMHEALQIRRESDGAHEHRLC